MSHKDEQVVEFYDFLYRDSNRLTSYYSQIFEGKLNSIEELENNRTANQKTGGLNLQIISGQYQKTNEDQASLKRVFDPHDMNTTNVLSFLEKKNYIYSDYYNAPNGAMIIAKGKLFFTDKNLLSVSAQYISLVSEQDTPLQEITKEQKLEVELIKHMLSDGFFQPIYFLQTDEGHTVTGTVKEIGLEEPISTHYIKYGGWGLDGVYIIGLKEEPELLDEERFSQMFKATNELIENISSFLCGDESIKVTPLAIFRKIEPIKNDMQ